MRQDIPLSRFSPLHITNSGNPKFAEKFQYFGDFLKLICVKSGEFHRYEIENHLSLLNHLLFIANCTLDHPHKTGNTLLHIQFIVSTHPLLTKLDTFIEDDNSRQLAIQELVEQIVNEPCQDSINNLINIRDYLVEIKNLLEPNYIKLVVKCIMTKFGCKHSLAFHKEDFESLARLIFAYYYLKGYSRNTIGNFIMKCLDGEARRVGHRIYTESYLPLELYTRQIANNRHDTSIDESLSIDIQEYLKNRGAYGQVQSLEFINHYNLNQFTLVFKLDGLITHVPNDRHPLIYEGVEILSVEDFRLQYKDYDLDSSTSGFFQHGIHSAIAIIKVEAISIEDAVYIGLENLQHILGKIMRRVNGYFSINRKSYCFHEAGEKEFFANNMPEIASISDFTISNLNRFDQVISASPHKHLYLALDSILQQGYLENDLTLALHHYRRFMDILNNEIPESGIRHDKTTGIPSDIIKIALTLLYFDELKFKEQIKLWAHNKITNSVFLPTSNNELVKAYRNTFRKNDYLLPKFSMILKHIVPEQKQLKSEVNLAKDYKLKVNQQQVYEYYVRHLLFIKQYRDKFEHANLSDDKVAKKLSVYTYRIFSHFLQMLFLELNDEKHEDKSHKEILQTIVQSAKNRLPQVETEV